MGTKLRAWHVRNSDLLLIAWVFFAIFVASAYISKGVVAIFGNTVLATLLSTFIMHLSFFLYALGVNFYYKFRLFCPRLRIGDLLKKSFKYFFFGAALVFSINIITNLIALIFDYKFEPQNAIDLWQKTNGFWEKLLAFIPTVILAPLAEEMIFRGLLYRLLKTRINIIWAMILSSVLFSMIHFSLLALLPLTLLAMLLCFIYEKFGDLRLCILVHSFFNLFNVVLLILVSSYGGQA